MIVDDEPAARSHLRSVIELFKELEIISEISDGKTAIHEISKNNPDIVFLDIDMPEVDGFNVASATAHLNYQLVFVTAYDQYALNAFNTNAIDYLLKPVRPSLLQKCIKKILYQKDLAFELLEKEEIDTNHLVLAEGNSQRIINYEHICYIEAIGRYRRIHLTQSAEELYRMRTTVSDTTLDEFESILPESWFMRLHRSYIVNLKQIIGLTVESRRHFASLARLDIKIPVSRSKVKNLKARL